MSADPKPRRRLVLSNREYLRLVRAMLASYPTCELCFKRASESAHHVVSKGQGGDDVGENLAMLCGSGTTLCHGEVETSREARARLRPRLRPETISYVLQRKGAEWLDRKYPL